AFEILNFSDFTDEKERLDERLIQLNNGAKYNQVVILAGGAGCFAGNTLVKTKDGYKPISDISVGDIVQTYNEETGEISWDRVVDTKKYASEEHQDRLMMLETEDGERIICTENHEFFVDGKWVKAKDL
ncbi:MAG: hypothetical protein D6834_01775, partial [Aquificota bacterium]